MTQTTENPVTQIASDMDLMTAIQQVLQESSEPLTVSKIRAALPSRLRGISPEELTNLLNRQVTARVLYGFPRYRSQQDRYWDRPMEIHVAALIGDVLQNGPLAWSELRRKIPAYAQLQMEEVLQEQVTRGRLHRHPRSGRGGDRFSVQPPDIKEYLRPELAAVFSRLEALGFTPAQLRAGSLELLHEEEWAATPATPVQETQVNSPAEQPATSSMPEQP